MKNLIFIFLFWLSLTVIFAQSCCVAHNSSILNGDANVPSVTLKKKQAQIDLIGDNTWFKTVAIAQTNTHDHSHHTHQSTTPMQLKGSFSSSIQVRYGLTSRLTLHIQQPYTIIRTDSQNISGLADVNLLSTYQIFQNSKYSVGASLGLELPTGSSYQIVNNNYFILGSGSFDPLAGISATHKCNKWLFRLNVLYRQGMKGYDNFHFGSALSNQIWAFYPLIKKENSSFVWNVNGFFGTRLVCGTLSK